MTNLRIINMQTAAQTNAESKQAVDAQLSQYRWVVQNLAAKFSTRFASASQDDLEQVGLIALTKAIESYDPSRAKFATYAHTFVRGRMRDFLRDAPDSSKDVSLDAGDDEDDAIQIADSSPNPEQALLLDERNEVLTKALEKLSDDERGLIQMHFWDGYTVRDLADRLDTSKSSIDRAIHRVLHKLRPLVEELQ